jgi:hypothetical protein
VGALQPVFGLQQRASGDHQESPAITCVFSPGRLGDVRADRISGSAELGTEGPLVE